MTFLEPQHTGRRSHMTASTATAVSTPHSDYFGQASHSGSTSLTSPSLDTPEHKPASFHSLQDIQEAIEASPLGLGPPPGSTRMSYSHGLGLEPGHADNYAPSPEPAYYSASSSGHMGDSHQPYSHPPSHYEPQPHHQPQHHYEPQHHYQPAPEPQHRGILGDAGIYANLNHNPYAPENVDPLYADDDDEAAELQRGPSVKSRASQYEASILSKRGSYASLNGSLGAPPRSPSAMSGRRSPNRFPSNPDRPGSPMRLPPSPGLGPTTPNGRGRPPSSPQRLPPSPSVGNAHLSPAPPARSPRQSSPQRLPIPPASPVHAPRAPSPLSLSSTAPEEEPMPAPVVPAPTPRALPQPPQTQAQVFHQQQPSSPPSASRTRRAPDPASAPPADSQLKRGAGSTKRMVTAWENSNTSPTTTPSRLPRPLPNPVSAPPLGIPPQVSPQNERVQQREAPSPSPRRLSHKFMDGKPLPIPTARPIPASASMPWPPPATSRAQGQIPSPLDSPRSKKATPRTSPIKALSPSSWSSFARKANDQHQGEVDTPTKSPAGSANKSPMPTKRSPFAEIKSVFSGLRKKGKDKDERPTGWGTAMVGVNGDKPHQFISLEDDKGWFAAPLRHPPVMDRMGDAEMALSSLAEENDNIRSSAALYLAPVPSSTKWGSWMTSWATLSRQTLAVTFVPVYQPSPRRGSLYDDIQPPSGPLLRPDEDLSMLDCVEVRSLRRDEIKGRGIPHLPVGGGSEVLELSFAHGTKRYLAVDGVAGRLGWVSAIWDVLLACKDGAKLSLPPPSPSLGSIRAYHDGSLRHFGDLSDQPVQKVGDTWVASGLPPSSEGNTPELDSVARLPGPLYAANATAGETHFQAPSPINPQLTGPHTAAALEDMAAADEDEDVPPPPPPKPRARSTLIEERMRAFGTPETKAHPMQVSTEPIKTTAPLRLGRPTPPTRRENSTGTLRTQETSATLGAASGLQSPDSHSQAQPRGAQPRARTTASATPTTAVVTTSSSSSTPLREASLRMLDTEPKRSSKMEDRIRSWQPHPEDTPPPMSRAGSGRSGRSQATELSFNPSDLNPSRSASQVRPRTDHHHVDLAGVDAGLARLPAVAELSRGVAGVGGPRSPAKSRKRVPQLDAVDTVKQKENESEKVPKAAYPAMKLEAQPKMEVKPEPAPKLKSEPVLERTSTPPAPTLVPELDEKTTKPADLSPPRPTQTPGSPKVTPRLNARMLAAAAIFEPSIVDRATPKSASADAVPRSPFYHSARLHKSPSIKMPIARASPCIKSLEQAPEVAESSITVSKGAEAEGTPKALKAVGTGSTLSEASKTSPKSAKSTVSSVRDRIEALSRVTDSRAPASASPKTIPRSLRSDDTGTNKSLPRSPRIDTGTLSTLPETQAVSPTAWELRGLSPRSTSSTRSAAPLSPKPVTAPLSIKRPQPALKRLNVQPTAAPLSPPKKRTLFVANPGPDSPEPTPRAVSEVSAQIVSAPKAETESAQLPTSAASDAPAAEPTQRSPVKDAKPTPRGLGISTTSRIDYSDDTATSALTSTTKCTTERESIDGVLAGYADTPTTMAPSQMSSIVAPPNAAVPTDGARTAAPSVANLTPSSTGDHTVLAALNTHTAEHGTLSRQLEDVQFGVNALAASVGGVSSIIHEHHEQEQRDHDLALPERLDALNDGLAGIHSAVATFPPDLAERLAALGTDLRGVQMVLYESSAQIAALAARDGVSEVSPTEKDLPPPPEGEKEAQEPKLPEINAKLDALAVLIQEVLARQDAVAAAVAAGGALSVGAAGAAVKEEKDAKVTPDLPKDAPDSAGEVEAPKEAPKEAPVAAPAADAATAAQFADVQASVAKLGEERALQTQQMADIAKYLSDLNGWLEKFVTNSGSELAGMNTRLDGILKAGEGEDAPSGAIADMHRKLDDAAARAAEGGGGGGGGGGVQAERLDALVALMSEERERAVQQSGVVDHVVQLIEKQGQDNEILLRAVATDLSSEIRGERVRFIEAMREATTMNMQIHVDEFKKALTNEVSQSMRELGTLREQKKALEHRIADLFALIAKHGEEGRMPQVVLPTSPPVSTVPPPSPGGARALPTPPQ